MSGIFKRRIFVYTPVHEGRKAEVFIAQHAIVFRPAAATVVKNQVREIFRAYPDDSTYVFLMKYSVFLNLLLAYTAHPQGFPSEHVENDFVVVSVTWVEVYAIFDLI